jgi:hypothetical protein
MSCLGLLAWALVLAQPASVPLTLEIRIFRGSEEVTAQTRLTVHRAGERGQPVAVIAPGGQAGATQVAPGIYDVQAVQESDGRVVNIRWAERLVVMPYPDEEGRHLEVVNFSPGYGAIQLRTAPGTVPADELALFGAGDRGQPAPAAPRAGYTLFVVPAGQYDLQVKRGSKDVWHNGIEVPLDRTRLWIVRN